MSASGQPPTLEPLLSALWPPPAEAAVRRAPKQGEREYLAFPSIQRPHMLIPVGVKGAEKMMARYGGSRAKRFARLIARRAYRSSFLERSPIKRLCVVEGSEGIERYLEVALRSELRIGILLGPPRASQKPVLQIFGPDGTILAFCKVGSTGLTEELLNTEATALRELHGRSTHTFRSPELLHHGRWGTSAILVQEALPLAQSNLAPLESPIGVMAEIAGLHPNPDGRLSQSALLQTAVAQGSRWFGIDLRHLGRLSSRLRGDIGCPLGSWHGDLGPWNMASNGTTTEIWDWERFATGVPVGCDAAHYRTQRSLTVGATPAEAWPQVLNEVAAVLQASGYGAAKAPIVAASYFLVIFDRYRRDLAHTEVLTPQLRRRVQWISRIAGLATDALDREATAP